VLVLVLLGPVVLLLQQVVLVLLLLEVAVHHLAVHSPAGL
jgi:hypothetical protein